MSILKIKDENGKWAGITTIKGDKGDPGDTVAHAHRHAKGGVDELTIEDIGAAPDGFGLGGFGVKVSNPNDITKSGYYVTNTNMPLNIYFFVEHHQYNTENYAWQKASTVANGIEVMCVRNKVGGTWGEWEWINPPFVNGTEYRTVERIGSKAVYKKNVNGSIQYRIDGDTTWSNYVRTMGGISRAGDTMSGALTVRNSIAVERTDTDRKARAVAYNNTSQEVDFQNYGDDSNYVSLRLTTEDVGAGGVAKIAHMKDGQFTSYQVLHTGNKEKIFTFGTEDLTAGSSSLATGQLHFVYE